MRLQRFRTVLSGVLSLLLCTVSTSSIARQTHSVQGRVVNAEDDAPMAGAQVFLAHTFIGSLTDGDGRFTLSGLHPMRYTLVVSSLGYDGHQEQVSVDGTDVPPLEIRLNPIIYEMGEIAVEAQRDRAWRRDIRTFIRQFVGSSGFARQTELENPFVIAFDRSDPQYLVATASEPLLIRNRALGYRIRYTLQEFLYDRRTGTVQFVGQPFFEEMEPSDPRERYRWRQNRISAFTGSSTHFLWALYHDRLDDEGFLVMPVRSIEDDVTASRQRATGRGRQMRFVDALDLMDAFEDRTTQRLFFNQFLKVAYHGRHRAAAAEQLLATSRVSYLTLDGAFADVYLDGHYFHTYNIRWYGDMAAQRTADMLPREFVRAHTSQ